MSEKRTVSQSGRTTYRMPAHTNPRGLQNERCVCEESSTLVPQNGRASYPTVAQREEAYGGKGARKTLAPAVPRVPSHVGVERAEPCQPRRSSSQQEYNLPSPLIPANAPAARRNPLLIEVVDATGFRSKKTNISSDPDQFFTDHRYGCVSGGNNSFHRIPPR